MDTTWQCGSAKKYINSKTHKTMYVKEYFYNIQCDCCKALANEELWRVDEEGAKEDADESGWYTLGGKHYCPNCVKIDDENNIITADGKVWDGDTYELIRCLKEE